MLVDWILDLASDLPSPESHVIYLICSGLVPPLPVPVFCIYSLRSSWIFFVLSQM
jgi:hypothetical protein